MPNGTIWQQIELAAEKEDSDAVGEVSETASDGLDRLDPAVEAFSDGIGDRMHEVGQQALLSDQATQ